MSQNNILLIVKATFGVLSYSEEFLFKVVLLIAKANLGAIDHTPNSKGYSGS